MSFVLGVYVSEIAVGALSYYCLDVLSFAIRIAEALKLVIAELDKLMSQHLRSVCCVNAVGDNM